MTTPTAVHRQRREYRVTLLDHEGNEVRPGTAAWERLQRRVAVWYATALAWERDHPQESGERAAS